MGEKSEHSGPIIQRDQHDAFARQRFAIIDRQARGAFDEAAAIDPHHDRQAARRDLRGAQMLSVRQSSLTPGARLSASGFCMQSAPNFVASRTPAQDATGSGGRQRSMPTGGAA